MKALYSILLAGAALTVVGAQAEEHLYSLDPTGIDKSVDPGKDFYTHVNRGWMENHPLSPAYSRYGQFNVLNDSSNNRVRRIVSGLQATNPAAGTNAYKVATLYEQGLDSIRRNQLGAKPIRPILDKIEATPASGMEDLFILMQKEYGAPFIGAGPQEDLGNSSVYAMYVGNGQMGLGDRDYYLAKDKRNTEVREAYRKLITQQMQNAGYSKKDAKRIASNVMKIETLMADSALTREESRNIPALYNVRPFEFLKTNYPNLPWDRLFIETMGIPSPENVIVTELRSANQANKLYGSLTDREKKDLYLWQVVGGAAPYLSDDFSAATFEFSKVKSGVKEMHPRWKRSLSTTEGLMGEAIGELYVSEYFPESSKTYMIGLVENLRNGLAKHIMHLPWMSDDTKVQGIKKLNAITVKIGYPDKWKDYSALEINPELSYWENVHNANMWHNQQQLNKWGKPVDRSEWGMNPQEINAYYNPVFNEIVFPAGILQAPFFDPNASDAENYGGIGVVIGHELTHGFDDQGCNFDADGNMINWWTEEDAEAFRNLTQGLVAQFDEVEVLPGLHANGAYTLGENIADQGGLRVAMTAFLDSQKKKGVDVTSEEALIDGYTPAQVYYMNYANLWAQNIREAEMRALTSDDVHSLGSNRVNVSLRNLAPFFEAFGITSTDPMWRPETERVIIW
ncbi:MAG: M13 family metallopeptidase [Bacteroides sp.]|nr:M13 family metallopeptidase [Bacteroides sp.]